MALAALATVVVAVIAMSGHTASSGPALNIAPSEFHLGTSSSATTSQDGVPIPATDTRGFLRISIVESVPFLVTDPNGRRTGTDPATGHELAEIPDAAYLPDEHIADPEDPQERTRSHSSFELIGPIDGTYVVQLASTTRTSVVASFFQANRAEGTSKVEGAARVLEGSVPRYLVRYRGGVGQTIEVQRADAAAKRY